MVFAASSSYEHHLLFGGRQLACQYPRLAGATSASSILCRVKCLNKLLDTGEEIHLTRYDR